MENIKIDITGKNIELTEGLKSFVSKRAEKLTKYFAYNPQLNLKVVLSVEKERHTAEVTLPIMKTIIRTEQTTNDMYLSIDMAFAVIEKQIVKYKNKLVTKKQTQPLFNESFLKEENVDKEIPKIAKQKEFKMIPMTPEEACIEMDLVGHDFYAFCNETTNKPSIVYRRKNNTYGLIELENL